MKGKKTCKNMKHVLGRIRKAVSFWLPFFVESKWQVGCSCLCRQPLPTACLCKRHREQRSGYPSCILWQVMVLPDTREKLVPQLLRKL
jgi:hypothetical protein